MNRRDFLKFGASGLTLVAVGSMADWPLFLPGSRAFAAGLESGQLVLDMVDATAEMVDGIQVPMWAFKLKDTTSATTLGGARIPGPVLVALEGDRIRLLITNSITTGGAHGFSIPGVVSEVNIPARNEVRIEFIAPAAGTYMYLDPENAPVNRVMGLHGVLVVLPNPVGNNTPYSNPSNRVQQLFDDLGRAAHFPGNPWDPSRNAIWVFNAIDPVKAAIATAGPKMEPSAFLGGFLPQYFTINGKSGFFSAQHGHGDDNTHTLENTLSIADGRFDAQGSVSIRGTVGQPIVIRNLNAGLMWHSPHIHGNHVYPLTHTRINAQNSAVSREILNNLTMLDTWSLAPGDIKDVLLPFIMPPDIPALALPLVDESYPLVYPMHDHNEISNTAAGGNYPQGMATHWQIDGPFNPDSLATAVIIVDRAEMRVKTGQLLIEGRFTVPSPTEANPIFLDVHAGGSDGPMIGGRIRVGTDGRFSFRGRALKALGGHFVTLMHHEGNMVHASRTAPLRLR